ncbi:hypothetical protein Aazo_3890 ['Nostoc azollae' 0708]|uniref:Uncharacterized protein n=1 Tax=Nostoc azollae (strain 0708) TaxID=551115 RepID=D7E4T2_NOSA0|nr:hypothetical protein Aazo_3890 ['Nostoc azollae' 0708]
MQAISDISSMITEKTEISTSELLLFWVATLISMNSLIISSRFQFC